MKVIITTKNFSASDNLKEKIEAKIGKLEKYFSDDIVANIMLSRERNRDKLEATINVKGTIFRAEEVSDDIYTSLDKAMDKLSGQMSRFKSRLQKKHKGGRDILFECLPENDDREEELKISKIKEFELRPMSTDEAVMQMELIGHDFFVFMNMDTASVNIVYKRKGESYGLLEPKY